MNILDYTTSATAVLLYDGRVPNSRRFQFWKMKYATRKGARARRGRSPLTVAIEIVHREIYHLSMNINLTF